MKKITMLLLTIAIILQCLPIAASAASQDDLSTYTFSYLSEEEAKAFLGFLINSNDLDKTELLQNDIYLYMIGSLKNDKNRESLAKIAFSEIVAELLNARLDEQHNNMTIASANICTYLEKKYGTNLTYELYNQLANQELKRLENITLHFVSIATNTDMVEIEAVKSVLGVANDLYKSIKDPQKKIKEYTEQIKMVLDALKFTSSVQRYDMYQQFSLYITHSQCFLNFGNTEIANTYIYLTQSAHDLCNERVAWANCAEEIIKFFDVFGLLNDCWLDWDTDSRIALLKKWANFVVYTKASVENDISTSFAQYSLTQNQFVTESGNIVRYNSRSYNAKHPLAKTIETTDITYHTEGNHVIIDKYIGPDGKYNCVIIPSIIDKKRVSTIGSFCFEESNFTELIIPKEIAVIEDYAFYNSTSINSIIVLGNKTKIANTAFDWIITGSNGLVADQSFGNTLVYCEPDSLAKQFSDQKDGFNYRSLDWNGSVVRGIDCVDYTFNIYTANDLAYISDLVNSGYDLKDYTILLQHDIYLAGSQWTPIGKNETLRFAGNFDGNGYTIKGLNVTSGQFKGLFGCVTSIDSSFRNVTINGTLSGSSCAGSLIADAHVPENGRLLCANCINATDINVSKHGGILGRISLSGSGIVEINNCHNTASLTTAKNINGGIIGEILATKNDTISLTNCSNSGIISNRFDAGYGGAQVGGLIGYLASGNLTISQCAVVGEIYAKAYGPDCGGLVGKMAPHSFTIQDCEMFAYINSTHTAGDANQAGLVGGCYNDNYDTSSYWVIRNTYVSAVMDGSYGQAGMVINNESGGTSLKNIYIYDSYFDTSKTSIPSKQLLAWTAILSGCNIIKDNINSVSGTYTSAQLTSKSYQSYLYSNWDFNNVWEFSPSGYPKLKQFDYIPCSKHDYAYNVVSSPTDTTTGLTNYTCTLCHYNGSINTCGMYDGNCYQVVDTIESPHSYPNNYSNTWRIYKPYAESITITLSSSTIIETGWDNLYIYDKSDTLVGKYTGYDLGGQQIHVNGDTVKLKLVTDDSGKRYGFAISRIDVKYTDRDGHNYSEYISNNDASCLQDGTKTAECKNCGFINTIADVGSQKPHDFVNNVCQYCSATNNDSPNQVSGLTVSKVTLRPSNAALYFEGVFSTTTELDVTRHGIVVSLENATPVADDSDSSCLYTNCSTSVLLADIMCAKNSATQNMLNAKTPIFARAYVVLENGTYLYSSVVHVSLEQVITAVDLNWSNLNQTQKESIIAMYQTFIDTMDSWNIPNIKEASTPPN